MIPKFLPGLPRQPTVGLGLVTIAPAANFTGSFNHVVGVRAVTQSSTQDWWDTQLLPVLVLPDALVADFDSDAVVDGADFLTWQRGLTTGSTQAQGDATGDGVVDKFDLAAWGFQFEQQAAAVSTASQSVPEPSTLALVFVMALFAGKFRRQANA